MSFKPTNSALLEKAEHLGRANSLLMEARSRCESVVSPSTDRKTSKLLWEVRQYVQLTLHRSADLGEEVCSAWDKAKPAISFVLARALMETAAATFEFGQKIEQLLSKGQYDELHKTVLDRMFASKDNPDLRPAQNILTAIDKVDRTYEGFRDSYNMLSEFAHPNYSGMNGLYVKDEDPYPIHVQIGSAYGINQFTFPVLLYPFIQALEVLLSSVEKIQSLYPELVTLATQYEH